MTFYLLTHPRELKRTTNSGTVVLKSLGDQDVKLIPWERNRPDRELLSVSQEENSVLIYHDPRGENIPAGGDLTGIENFILLDGTWQEARKMYNKSPYLHEMKRYVLPVENESLYNIRRNQTAGGLCTAECVIEILKIRQESEKAGALLQNFLFFLKEMISRAAYRPPGASSQE